jgi:uncharacterized integral membrane protein
METASDYKINAQDIREVRVYRGGIVVSALGFLLGTILVLLTQAWDQPSSTVWIREHRLLLGLAAGMVLAGTGISVMTIHLYIRQFHTLLKILFGIGLVSVMLLFMLSIFTAEGFLSTLYQKPYGTFGFGFILATLCGIAVKEAFCFGQIEAVLFALVTPVLVLGHIFGALSPSTAFALLCVDTLLLCIFAIRKEIMPVDLDIGDKSVYAEEG